MIGKSDHIKLVKNKNKAQPGWKRALRFLCKLVIVAVMILLLKEGELFFRINSITVEGSLDISTAELAAAGDINKGTSIFLLNEEIVAEKIKTEYPSVSSVQVKRTLPDQVIVSIDQREPAAYIVTADGYWLIDNSVVPYKNSTEPEEDYIQITGVSGELVVPGIPLNCSFRREILQEFFSAWQNKDGFQIDKLDLNESYNLVAYTVDNLEIWLGNAKNMQQKLDLVELSLPYISKDLEGAKLDVRTGKRLVVSSAAVLEKREVDP